VNVTLASEEWKETFCTASCV